MTKCLIEPEDRATPRTTPSGARTAPTASSRVGFMATRVRTPNPKRLKRYSTIVHYVLLLVHSTKYECIIQCSENKIFLLATTPTASFSLALALAPPLSLCASLSHSRSVSLSLFESVAGFRLSLRPHSSRCSREIPRWLSDLTLTRPRRSSKSLNDGKNKGTRKKAGRTKKSKKNKTKKVPNFVVFDTIVPHNRGRLGNFVAPCWVEARWKLRKMPRRAESCTRYWPCVRSVTR